MSNKILYFLLSFFLLSCGDVSPTNQDPGLTAVNNWDSSLEEMKKETLAQTCNDRMKDFYENRIASQSKYLTPEQLKRSMQNMQRDIICE